jgi:hypothetical protein
MSILGYPSAGFTVNDWEMKGIIYYSVGLPNIPSICGH